MNKNSQDKTEKVNGKKKKKMTENVDKDQDFVQAISIQLINGLVMTGTYIGLQTKLTTTHRFLTDTIDQHGENNIIVGDLNPRNPSWDTTLNDRGMAVMEVLQKDPRAHVIAASEPSFFKKVKKGWWRIRYTAGKTLYFHNKNT